MAEGIPYFQLPAPLDQKDLGRYVESELRRVSAAIDWLWNSKFSGAMGAPVNFELSPSVASNALTMAVKTEDGDNASEANPVRVPFRSATAGSGSVTWRTVTAALSLTISSGSTLGHNSGLKQYIYWYLLDNAGTVELAASSKFFGQHGIVSTTAEGGAGAADSGTVMYSTTARTNVPFLCVGYTEDTQTTAGTWTVAPSAVHLAPFTLPVISFSAHRTTNQTVATGTDTKLQMNTEAYDNGGLFDAVTNFRWVPPPGKITMSGSIRWNALVDQTAFAIKIFKNGIELHRVVNYASGTGGAAVPIPVEDECNGTDYYELFANQNTGVNQDIVGAKVDTFIFGSWTPGRS